MDGGRRCRPPPILCRTPSEVQAGVALWARYQPHSPCVRRLPVQHVSAMTDSCEVPFLGARFKQHAPRLCHGSRYFATMCQGSWPALPDLEESRPMGDSSSTHVLASSHGKENHDEQVARARANWKCVTTYDLQRAEAQDTKLRASPCCMPLTRQARLDPFCSPSQLRPEPVTHAN